LRQPKQLQNQKNPPQPSKEIKSPHIQSQK
jgi:hypothetical protein